MADAGSNDKPTATPDAAMSAKEVKDSSVVDAPPAAEDRVLSQDKPLSDFLATDFEYTDDTPGSLNCPVCMVPLHNPVVTTCGHTFCESCVSVERCHICREEGVTWEHLVRPQASFVLNMLDELKVHCSRRPCGCHWEGPRSNLEEHIGQHCQTFACSHKDFGCEWVGRTVEVTDHAASCDFLPVSCCNADVGCTWQGLAHDAVKHQMPYEGATQYDAGVGCPFFFVAQTVRSLRSELDELRETVSSDRSEVDLLLEETRRDLSAVATRNDQVCTAVGKICVHSAALNTTSTRQQAGQVYYKIKYFTGQQQQHTSGGWRSIFS